MTVLSEREVIKCVAQHYEVLPQNNGRKMVRLVCHKCGWYQRCNTEILRMVENLINREIL